MFNNLFTFKKEIGKLKIKSRLPFDLTPEKIVNSPRAFNTTQLKDAIGNLEIVNNNGNIKNLLTESSNFILKDFFFNTHQSGLYNRQLKLWKVIGHTTQIVFYKLQKGLIKKQDLDAHVIDFLVDSKTTSIRAIIPESTHSDFDNLKFYLSCALKSSDSSYLKGIFYFTNKEIDNEFMEKLNQVTDTSDEISKYEATIYHTNDVRLNIIIFKNENGNYTFEHIFPKIEPRSMQDPQNQKVVDSQGNI